jgi:cytochrome P450 family 3 subfamily A/cytochrome P450 family 3 subfamily C
MRKYIGAFAMDVITSCAYGVNTDSLNNPNHLIVTNAKRILNVDAGIGLFLSIMAPPIAKFFKCEPFDSNSVNFFDAITNKIVKERKKLQQSEENGNKNFFDKLEV